MFTKDFDFCSWQIKKPPNSQEALAVFCTRGRDRTGTVLLPLVFETNASTNSATRASFVYSKTGANLIIMLISAKKKFKTTSIFNIPPNNNQQVSCRFLPTINKSKQFYDSTNQPINFRLSPTTRRLNDSMISINILTNCQISIFKYYFATLINKPPLVFFLILFTLKQRE